MRVFLHRQDRMEIHGLNCVVIHTVDADIVVLSISVVTQKTALKLFMAFGTQRISDMSVSRTWQFF